MDLKIILISILIASCASQQAESKKFPNRLKGIPDSAFWIGGSDGGNWYVVHNINRHGNQAEISVYNGQDGSLIMNKNFTVICYADAITFFRNPKDQINAFDGEKIYLKAEKDRKACWLQ